MGTAALIIVLSVFSGFTQLIGGLYGSMDPDLLITPKKGKFIGIDSLPDLSSTPGLLNSSYVLEERALLSYNQKEYVATVKGVDANFISQASADGILRSGRFFEPGSSYEAVLGEGVSYYLSLGLSSGNRSPIDLYLPKNEAGLAIQALDAFERSFVYSVGIFRAQADYDAKYILMPLQRVQELLKKSNEVSSIHLYLDSNQSVSSAQAKVEELLGDDYIVENSMQQHAFMYKVMQTEKWAIYLIFTFILIIAAFNLIGSVTMLILDKLPEIKTLWSLGATWKQIRNLFWWEGILLSGFGGAIGLVIGVLVCWLQETFGLLSMGPADSFIVNAYPVDLTLTNVLMVALTVAVIGLLSALIPVMRLRYQQPFNQEKA